MISFLAITLMGLGPATILLPLLTVGLTVWFLPPSSLENRFVARLARGKNFPETQGQETFLVQLTLTPRLRAGLRALVEDADDFGYLAVTDSALVYEGDAVKLRVPFDHIRALECLNTGPRGLFPRLVVVAQGLGECQSLQIGERVSWMLPTSRKITRTLFERLSSKIAPAKSVA